MIKTEQKMANENKNDKEKKKLTKNKPGLTRNSSFLYFKVMVWNKIGNNR